MDYTIKVSIPEDADGMTAELRPVGEVLADILVRYAARCSRDGLVHAALLDKNGNTVGEVTYSP